MKHRDENHVIRMLKLLKEKCNLQKLHGRGKIQGAVGEHYGRDWVDRRVEKI